MIRLKSLLIDDDEANIKSWKDNGGIEIKTYKTTDVQATINQLKKYFDLD